MNGTTRMSRGEVSLKSLGASIVTLATTMEKDTKFSWTAFNPSVTMVDGKMHCAIRSSNYVIRPDGTYKLLDYGDFLNRVWIGQLGNSALLENAWKLEQAEHGMRRGVEDSRLFVRNGRKYLASIAMENWIPKARVVECLLSDDMTAIESVKVLEGPNKDRVEKNWMPVHDTTAEFDYLYSPTMTYSVSGSFTQVSPQIEIPSGLRGGSQLIEHEDGLLGVMHQTLIFSEIQRFSSSTFTIENVQRRKYTHYLVKMNRRGEITAVSRPFYFSKQGVEFAAGVAKTPSQLLISFGAEDVEAKVAILPIELVDSLFTYRSQEGIHDTQKNHGG